MADFSLGFKIGGDLSPSFLGATNKAGKQLKSIGQRLSEFKGHHFKMPAFKSLAKDADNNKTALTGLNNTLTKTGHNTSKLTRESKKLASEFGKLKKMQGIDLKLGNLKSEFAAAKGEMVGLIAGGYTLGRVYGSASKVLKGQGEVASLGVSEDGINAITKAGQNMALKFGQVSAPEFIQASYDIKSGISSLTETGITQFTKYAATTAVATKASVGEMTKLYALGYGIFREDFGSDIDFGKKFSGAISASVQMFRTDGADLSAGLSSIGGSATAMGVSMTEQLSILGIAKGSYSTASEAATGYKSALNGLGKSQEKLGLDFTNAQGNMLPMADILDKLKEKYGDMDLSENLELTEALGGAEATKFITSMINKTDDLRKANVDLDKSMQGGLSTAEAMAASMDRGYGAEKLGNSFGYLGFVIGKTLEPAFNGLAWVVGGVAKGVAWLDDKVSFLIPTIVGVTTAIGVTFGVMKTAKLASMALSYANLSLQKSYLGVMAKIPGFNKGVLFGSGAANKAAISKFSLGGALKFLTSGLSIARVGLIGFTTALVTNPIGLIVMGIASAGFLIYRYWKPIKAFMGGVWDGFKSSFAPITASLKPFFSLLGSAFSPIVSGAKSLFGWLGKLLTPVDVAADKLQGFASTGEKVGALIGSAFKVAFFPLVQGAKLLGWASEKLSGIFGSDTTVTTASKSSKQVYKPNVAKIPTIKPQKLQPANITQDVNVVVNKPSSTVELEAGIANGLRNASRRNASLADEDI